MNPVDRKKRSRLFLAEMGLGPIWTMRENARSPADSAPFDPAEPSQQTLLSRAGLFPAGEDSLPATPASEADSTDRYAPQVIAHMDWQTLAGTVSGCVKCGLCAGRTKTVFGTGDTKASWLFIGEGPGRNEDLEGEPFIGQAGRLLDNMLLSLDLKRGENAYIANVVKCRATDANGRDRPPSPEEAAACLPYLRRQIELIQPSVLVALGKTAAIALLALDPATPVGALRGTVHRYGQLPLVVTYHPAYLLRRPADKAKVWEDLCLAIEAHAADGHAVA